MQHAPPPCLRCGSRVGWSRESNQLQRSRGSRRRRVPLPLRGAPRTDEASPPDPSFPLFRGECLESEQKSRHLAPPSVGPDGRGLSISRHNEEDPPSHRHFWNLTRNVPAEETLTSPCAAGNLGGTERRA